MKNVFSIGETAKINNISIQALRHYDKIDLLKPSFINKDSGYRYYSIDQFIYIDIIKHAKNFGIPLKELKNTLTLGNMHELAENVRSYHVYLDEQIQSLHNAKERFEKVAEMIEYSLMAVENLGPYRRIIEERNIIKLSDYREVGNFEINSRLVEADTKKSGLEFGFESGYFIDVPTFINSGEEFFTSAYLVFMDGELPKQPLSSSEYIKSFIPKGDYVCITYNEHNKDERIKQIQGYLKENNIEKIEFIIVSELYDDFRNQSNEIQVFLHPQ
ncbi:MerR family transcriptional regulator [Paenibacillus anaericanus]|uniref:MerR family transcriptional regulator n=1 Tax=Paenibacillus anaericanus TaxID=170367 RepID=A0A3S1BGF4_9BACL|nr:helix-turn-helix domain-containing protein [Paenibacillus anaericanus]RUT40317.1 MerR family transcriptional regulator [Paenibacillus anaericanus]